MATIKIILRLSSPTATEGTLYFRVIHKRKICKIHTGYRVHKEEWDEKQCNVIADKDPSRREFLSAVQRKLTDNLARLKRIIDTLDLSGAEYSAEDVAEKYSAPDAVVGFISFARKLISDCKQMGKTSAAVHYTATLNSFIRFNGDEEVPFEMFDIQLMTRYEQYLRTQELCPNTTSYYMRRLRAIYNLAVDSELTNQNNPFRKVYTGVAKTNKRAVPLGVIKTLRNMDLKHDPVSEFARDMFLFSFYTRGMAIVDMSYLRKSDLHEGILTYRRHKTGQQLSIRWEEKIQEIVRRYDIADSDYLLPIIKPGGADPRRQYINMAHVINNRLKKLGKQLGLVEPLTMYRARHSWASIAQNNNIPVSVISQGMGHDSEKTTRIYLASLDSSTIDKANSSIINLLDD